MSFRDVLVELPHKGTISAGNSTSSVNPGSGNTPNPVTAPSAESASGTLVPPAASITDASVGRLVGAYDQAKKINIRKA